MDDIFIQLKFNNLKLNIKDYSFKILCIILYHESNGSCFPSFEFISKEYNISISTVKRGIKDLCNNNIIRREHRFTENGKITSNLYIINKEYLVGGKMKKNKLIEDYTTEDDLKKVLYNFLAMRNKIKKPMTDYAIELLLKKLNNFSNKIEILNQSILNSWQDIYEIKNINNNNTKKESRNFL